MIRTGRVARKRNGRTAEIQRPAAHIGDHFYDIRIMQIGAGMNRCFDGYVLEVVALPSSSAGALESQCLCSVWPSALAALAEPATTTWPFIPAS